MDLPNSRIHRLTDPSAVSSYTGDESSAFHGSAEAVVLPRNVGEICEVVASAGASRTPLTVSGAGTSITGSRVPDRGMVLGTERLRDIRAIGWEVVAGRPADLQPDSWDEVGGSDQRILLSPDRDRALVPAGVRLSELDGLLAADGLLYPPDPTEMTAMLGGTIATNASGARSYRYGSTRQWIDALLVVTSEGRALWVSRGDSVATHDSLRLPVGFPTLTLSLPTALRMPETKHAAGLFVAPKMDLVDLLVGSEGALVVVAAAVVRLTARPDTLLSIAGFFAEPEHAFAAAAASRSDRDVLSIEYFDGQALTFIREQYPQTPEAGACVLFETTFAPAGRHNPYPASALRRWESRFASSGATADWVATGEDLRGMKSFRHALPERVNRWVASRQGKLGTDMAVPAAAFPRMHERYLAAQNQGIATVLFGHLGQYHLHLNFLPEDEAQMRVAKELYRDLARTAVALGGTISAEHGVGKKHLRDEDGTDRPYLWFLYGEEGVRAIGEVKRTFDPAWFLNPGTMVPRP